MRNRNRLMRGFVRNIRRTLKNKIYALILTIIGIISTAISYDATGLVFMLMIAIPLFFAKDNWTY